MTQALDADSAPLAGLVVIELGHSVAAPFAGQILADLGLSTIRILTNRVRKLPGPGLDAFGIRVTGQVPLSE